MQFIKSFSGFVLVVILPAANASFLRQYSKHHYQISVFTSFFVIIVPPGAFFPVNVVNKLRTHDHIVLANIEQACE